MPLSLAEQLAEVRAAHRARDLKRKESSPESVLLAKSADLNKKQHQREGSPEIQVLDVRPAEKKRKTGNGENVFQQAASNRQDVSTSSTSVAASTSYALPSAGSSTSYFASFLKPSIRLTRTQGRMSGSTVRNTVTLGTIIDKRKISPVPVDVPESKGVRTGKMFGGFVYAYFIGQDELFNYLPFDQSRDCMFYVGRDAAMDSISRQLANGQSANELPESEKDALAIRAEMTYQSQYGKNFKTFFPKMKGGCAHSKFGCIVYDGFIRIFITSGNLMSLDTVFGDNHWFIVDLPKLTAGQKGPKNDFEQEFFQHAHALGLPKPLIDSLYRKYDFSSVSDIPIIASQPGNYSGEQATLYGALKLKEEVKGLVKGKQVEYEVCAGSIGGMGHDWLKGMLHAMSGGSFDTQRHKIPSDGLVMVYPTKSDIEALRQTSREGASQIGCHLQWARASAEIKGMFRHYLSKDEADDGTGKGPLFHMKSILAFERTKNSPPNSVNRNKNTPLYFYMGSANFSTAAWGEVVDDKRAKGGQGKRLTKIRNFELGVLVSGAMLMRMLESGTRDWEEVVPYQREGSGMRKYTGNEKPFNDASWVTGKD